ncbi:MAG: 2-hydroxy-3-oxopropionate reductase [Thermomicrobiales bacterium]|nr:2-hydroxy-3-oxopropionate reductase [Thermomicrobiales bacterium]
MTERIGFIGLGIMGRPMAQNLLQAGYDLTVYNRSRGPVAELVAAGASAAESPQDVAERSDVVITMLPDSPEVEAVVAGPGGVLAGSRAGTLLIDMSTISPAVSRALAQVAEARGVGMLDAPVSGGDVGARQGTLSIMVGGRAEDFQRAAPIFAVLGKTVTHVGASGAGQVVKACNQIVVASTIEAVSEALVLGSKAGVAPSVILQVLAGGLAGNRVMEVRGPNFLSHDFTPGFKAALHHKDLGIALTAARDFGVALPVTGVVDGMFQALKQKGRGEQDHSALLTLLEDWAQHTIGESRHTAS